MIAGVPAFLALFAIVDVVMFEWVHVGHRAAADDVGHAVREQLTADDKHSRRSWTADELVRAEEDRVLVRERMLRRARAHLDLDVRRGGGEVPERKCSVPMQQIRDRKGVGENAGDVRRGRERRDLPRPGRVPDELLLESPDVDVPVDVLRDHHDFGDRLPPGQLVGVMLVWAEEHDWAALGWNPARQVVAIVQRGRKAQPEDAYQLVDGAGRAGAAEDHARVVVTADRIPDDPACILTQPARLPSRSGRLGVGVGVSRQDVISDHVLDEPEGPPARRVVGIRDTARPERADHHLVVADHRFPDPTQQRTRFSHVHALRVGPGRSHRRHGNRVRIRA